MDNLIDFNPFQSKLAVTLDLETSQKHIDEIKPNSPRYFTPTYIDPETAYLETPR